MTWNHTCTWRGPSVEIERYDFGEHCRGADVAIWGEGCCSRDVIRFDVRLAERIGRELLAIAEKEADR